MKIDKKEAELIEKLIHHWEKDQLIEPQKANQLRENYRTLVHDNRTFDWQNLAFIAFFFAITCLVLAVVLLLVDKWLMQLLNTLLDTSDLLKAFLFALLAVPLYWLALRRRRKHPEKVYSNEALFLFGAITVAFSLVYLGMYFNNGSGYFPMVILLTAISYGIIGIAMASKLTWIFCLLTLAVWFGTETGYRSGWEPYFLHMNYPLRFVLFGLVLLFAGKWFWHKTRLQEFSEITYITGLLGLFLALWLLSIFGNYGELDAWYQVSRISLIYWSILFGVGSALAIMYGLKYHDERTKDIGVAFLLLNLYTRYFEFFWDSLHKVIFFTILAVSFWLIGKQAENLWNIHGDKNKR